MVCIKLNSKENKHISLFEFFRVFKKPKKYVFHTNFPALGFFGILSGFVILKLV